MRLFVIFTQGSTLIFSPKLRKGEYMARLILRHTAEKPLVASGAVWIDPKVVAQGKGLSKATRGTNAFMAAMGRIRAAAVIAKVWRVLSPTGIEITQQYVAVETTKTAPEMIQRLQDANLIYRGEHGFNIRVA
jgi:hypothetical protein